MVMDMAETLMPENRLDVWRRKAREQEERFEKEREQEREQERKQARAKSMDTALRQWTEYFEGRIANERAALTEEINDVRSVVIKAVGELLEETSHEIETACKCALDVALGEVKKTIADHKLVVNKLLTDVAVLKRQTKALEDAHNKSIQNLLIHLQQRMAALETDRHVGNEKAIAKLQTRLEHAETELSGTAKLANLPAWIQE